MGTARASDPFAEHLQLIERAIRFVCRRRGLSEAEAEDFASALRVKLLEDDRAVLRKFRGRSRLETYLVTVAQRFYLDWRISQWGKWRASAEARRRGGTAMALERLLYREGFGFDEACRVLRDNHGVTASAAELAELAGRLPARTGRRLVGEEALAHRPAAEPPPDEAVAAGEAGEAVERALDELAPALAALEPEDRLILRLRFEDGLQVVAIARVLGLEARPLYRRIERLLKALRRELEAQGLSARELTEALARARPEERAVPWQVAPDGPVEKSFSGPSNRTGSIDD